MTRNQYLPGAESARSSRSSAAALLRPRSSQSPVSTTPASQALVTVPRSSGDCSDAGPCLRLALDHHDRRLPPAALPLHELGGPTGQPGAEGIFALTVSPVVTLSDSFHTPRSPPPVHARRRPNGVLPPSDAVHAEPLTTVDRDVVLLRVLFETPPRALPDVLRRRRSAAAGTAHPAGRDGTCSSSAVSCSRSAAFALHPARSRVDGRVRLTILLVRRTEATATSRGLGLHSADGIFWQETYDASCREPARRERRGPSSSSTSSTGWTSRRCSLPPCWVRSRLAT